MMLSKGFRSVLPANNWVSAHLLAQEEVWGADLFCGSAAQILLSQSERVTLRQIGGTCLEGWRVSSQPGTAGYDARIETTPIYRQGNLGVMRLRLDAEHWQPPRIEEAWCVRPGDVVINKLTPIRAVFVTDRTYRHPVDANCLLIRGLDFATSVWVAFCLNQSPYEAYLTQHQGLAVLPRASLRELRLLRIPAVPDEMQRIGQAYVALNEALLENEERLRLCIGGVEAAVQSGMEQLPDDAQVNRLKSGHFLPAESIEDSLLPAHVENAYFRRQLQRVLNWQPLEKVRALSGESRERLKGVDGDIRYLRLSDVAQDLMVEQVERLPVVQAARIYKRPVQEGEVLLSTFTASPRVAFVEKRPVDDIFVSDHWERLRFAQTPGAWALVLSSGPVQAQLSGLAMGTVQQFIYGDRINKIMLPTIPLALRREWADCLITHHRRKRELNKKWQALWAETMAVFQRVHSLPNGREKVLEGNSAVEESPA